MPEILEKTRFALMVQNNFGKWGQNMAPFGVVT